MLMSTASEILQVTTRLVFCGIKITGWGNFSHIHLMQLPSLRHLSICFNGCIRPFTDKLEVPGLQEINLDIIEYNSVNYKTSLAPLFQPQQGRIQKLMIDTQYLDHESFLEILQNCPLNRQINSPYRTTYKSSFESPLPSRLTNSWRE